MEVHRQTCQACGSRNVTNLLAREPGKNDKVYVKCSQCDELVAQYVILPGGYYHHKKSFESYLRGLARSGEAMSGKKTKKEFESLIDDVLESYERVLEEFKESHPGES